MNLRVGLGEAVLGTLMLLASPASAETLKVGGTGAVTELLRQLAPAFESETDHRLEVVNSLGTTGAIRALVDDKIGMAIGGRGLKEDEAARGLRVAATLRTPFGLVTSRAGPDNLKSADIASLYRADRPLWPDGMPILITLRPVLETDNIVLGNLFPGMADAIVALRQRRDLSLAATDQDNVELAETNKGSLAGATLTQIATEQRRLKFVSIDGVAVTIENFLSGAYRYEKRLFIVVPATPGHGARAFLAFLSTPAAKLLMRKAGVMGGDE